MITRSALSLGLLWLLMPHHPDLGLEVPGTAFCQAPEICSAALASDLKRKVIFQRLREVREEIRAAANKRVTGSARAALQNPDRLSGPAAAAVATGVLR
jgi:hypothetical protein